MPADEALERKRLRRSTRVGRGRLAWDKDRTRELFRRYKEEGDEEAREQLIESHLNLVRFLASKFKNRGEPLEDLVQVGSLGLIKAIDRFDPDRGLEFTTFATPTIMGEIKRHFRDKGWSVRVPRRLQELSARVNQVTDDLTSELNRTPTVEEVAERLDTSVDEVLEAMESSSAYSSVPLEGGTTEAEVAQHLEERQVARVADIVDVVGAQALLAGAGTNLGHGLDALVVLLELVHASVGQKQRRVVGNQRRGGIELAALRLKEVQEVVADLGRRHGLVVGAHGSPRIRCGNVQTGILAMRGHIPPEVQAQTGTYEANTT